MRFKYTTALIAFALAISVGCVDSSFPEDQNAAAEDEATSARTADPIVCPIPATGVDVDLDLYPQCMSCGNGACEPGLGETSSNCPADCGPTTYCGDHICNGSETSYSCPGDCGPPPTYCGDGVCNGSETSYSCPGDCGSGCYAYPCPCSTPYACPGTPDQPSE